MNLQPEHSAHVVIEGIGETDIDNQPVIGYTSVGPVNSLGLLLSSAISVTGFLCLPQRQ